MEQDKEVRRGAAVYNKPVLALYDLVVVRVSNSYVWRCHRERMAALYTQNMGRAHLDVGPGTGWYLTHSRRLVAGSITLLDINANSLASSSARLAASSPQTVLANVLEPLPSIGPFDSIGANFLFHCLPGTWSAKGVAFGHLARKLSPDGVLFGSTILGRGVHHNLIGRGLMSIYNDRGIFHNADDDQSGLEVALQDHFSDVTVDVVGAVALFRAGRPR